MQKTRDEKESRIRVFELLSWFNIKPGKAEISFINKTTGKPLIFDLIHKVNENHYEIHLIEEVHL